MGFSRTHTIPEGDPEFAPRHNVSFCVFWESLLSSDFRCSKLKLENTASVSFLDFFQVILLILIPYGIASSHMFSAVSNFHQKNLGIKT